MTPDSHNYFATCAKGLEHLIENELHQIGLKNTQPTSGGVNFAGPLRAAYEMCLWSRVANRILFPIKTFGADSIDQFYQQVTTIDWSQHFDFSNTIAVDFIGRADFVTNSLFGAQKTKDAIIDHFLSKFSKRPSVDLESPHIRINVYLKSNQVTISIDLSGHSLHQRGYRQAQLKAPIKENLAAAILQRANWRDIAQKGGAFIDPMCGSGTFLIEAMLIASNHAPGLFREDFGFNHWKRHDQQCWESLRKAAEILAKKGLEKITPCIGYDRDPRAVKAALFNIQNAGLSEYITVEKQALDQLNNPFETGLGLICTNPPYGERMSQHNELPLIYETIGEKLKNHFPGWNAAILCTDPQLGKLTAIRTHRIHTIYNGPIECKLLHFKIDPQWFFREPYRLTPDLDALAKDDAKDLQNRLKKNLKQIQSWASKNNVSCYRCYDADLPNYNIAVDLYNCDDGMYVHLQEYQAPKTIDPGIAKQRLREAYTVVMSALDVPKEQVYVKVRQRQKNQNQYEKLSEAKEFHICTEHNCKFYVNFSDYLDTGLFLDHRITRESIQSLARNKRFLNLFCYTASATVHAVKGGASASCSVDMSKTYIQWASKNFKLNHINTEKHELIQADCFEWLKNSSHRRFDLIFLDPPTFSNSKRMSHVLDIQRDHVELIELCMRLLTEKGQLIFSTNFRKFELSDELVNRFSVEKLSNIPRDFQRTPKMHHCWALQHK